MADNPPVHAFPDGRCAAGQPKWRRDFPIETAEDEFVSRRDFAKFLVLTSGAMTAGQAYLLAQSATRGSTTHGEPLEIARDADLAPGQVLQFNYPEPGDPCLLARLDDGRLVAFGQLCTHLSCPVVPDLPDGKLVCPCHKGYFDAATGQPLAGPPRRPLPLIVLEVRDGVIFATGVELRV